MTDIPPNDKLVRIYLKMRAKKAELKREYEAAVGEIEDQMKTVEGLLLAALNGSGASSMGTSHGTFYKETVKLPTCSDWEAYHNFLMEQGTLDGLEKRVAKGFVTTWMAEHDDELPPGLDLRQEVVVRVRTSNK